MTEAIQMCEAITGRSMQVSYDDTARVGDHRWWVSDTRKFSEHFGGWKPEHDIASILEGIYAEGRARWRT